MFLTDFKNRHLIYKSNKSENESLIKQNESRCVDLVLLLFSFNSTVSDANCIKNYRY